METVRLSPPEIEQVMRSLTVLVDTREQDTPQFRRRMERLNLPHKRCKLDFGDYSCAVTIDGAEVSLADEFAIERKMSLDELAACYTKGRKRFEREFERARRHGARVYLLIEKASWEKAYNGQYRSRMTPQSLTASMQAWLARYGCQIIMCEPETTPVLIRDICVRETKERLEAMQKNESDL